MQWNAPYYAWLALLLIPAYLVWRRSRRTQQLIRQRLGLTGHSEVTGMSFTFSYRAAVFLLLIAALCQPQWGTRTEKQEFRGIDIIVALDTSRSMLADDLKPNRLEEAKKSVEALTNHLQGDRIGLVAFAGSAFLVCPLTTDYATFRQMLADTGNETIPRGGSDLTGIFREVDRGFGTSEARSRLLLLVSDGEAHGNGSEPAARRFRDSGLIVGAAVAGSDAGAIIPLPGGDFLRDSSGRIVRSHAQRATLELFTPHVIRLDSDHLSLVRLHDQLRPSLQARSQEGERQQPLERFQYPLAFALLLLFAERVPFIRRRSLTDEL